jgi:hypothetical protein
MIGMTGNRAIKILEWVEATLKDIEPSELTQFERTLLERISEAKINIPGYGRVPAVEVRNITPKMKLVLEDANVWEVESIHKVDNNLFELALIGAKGRQIIRKRYGTRIGRIRET